MYVVQLSSAYGELVGTEGNYAPPFCFPPLDDGQLFFFFFFFFFIDFPFVFISASAHSHLLARRQLQSQTRALSEDPASIGRYQPPQLRVGGLVGSGGDFQSSAIKAQECAGFHCNKTLEQLILLISSFFSFFGFKVGESVKSAAVLK